MEPNDPGPTMTRPPQPQTAAALFWALRVAAAMCFIGHGAFGIITKEAWLPYFAVVGIGRDLGYRLMPLIGTVDVLLGISMLVFPTKAALAYMTLWAVWTALLRPLAGQGVSEFLERAGNYGVPCALLLIGLVALPRGGWLTRVSPHALDPARARRVSWLLRATTATLLLGHGALAVMGKPEIAHHLAAVGLGHGAASAHAMGWFEIALAGGVLAFPAWPLLLLVFALKIATEILFPLTGDYIWEFVERGGSYGAPLGLMILARAATGL